MKKLKPFLLTSVIFLSLAPIASAATLASVTATRDGQSHTVSFVGNGKYMKFTCSTNQPPTSSQTLSAECNLYRVSPYTPVVSYTVNNPASKSTDVFLNSGVTYEIQTYVLPYSTPGTTVTGTISDT